LTPAIEGQDAPDVLLCIASSEQVVLAPDGGAEEIEIESRIV
jgi:hypothetical protein